MKLEMRSPGLLAAYFLFYFIRNVSGHAVYLTYESYCADTSLGVGQTIMGETAIGDPNGRTIVVNRYGSNFVSGSYYVADEVLNVTVSTFSKNFNFEMVIQAEGNYILLEIYIIKYRYLV